jgi:hypothetical protein
MTLTSMLRGAAVTLAIAGVIDPSWETSRTVPAAVDLRVASGSDAERAAAESVRRRLAETLDGRVSFESPAAPVARVLVGEGAIGGATGDATIPTSVVTLSDEAAVNVRIVAASGPTAVPVGWIATFAATLEASGMSGRTSRIVLEQDGIELAGRDLAWSRSPERVDVSLPYAPPGEGISRVRLRVLADAREADTSDNEVDLTARAERRLLKILAHEPRPSWGTTFVRRALERNPAFEVSTLVHLSRGLTVKAGNPPPALTADALAGFDAVLVGAPEALGAAEVAALAAFARKRGGAVVLVPDRRPAGRVLELLQEVSFEEVLVGTALEVRSTERGSLHASELALPRGDASDANVLASTTVGKSSRPVVLSWHLGAGRVVFSGALDAWRYRGAEQGAFDGFWNATIAEAAMASPPRLDVAIVPALAAPGDDVTIRARLRQTELDDSTPVTRVPPIGARMIDAAGESATVRLWPAAETGTFEATVRPSFPGTYRVQVTSQDLTVEDQLMVAENVKGPTRGDASLAAVSRLVPSATGGVTVRANDLGPLEAHLRGLATDVTAEAIHPARSIPFGVIVASLLCLEWALRRRGGLA